MINRHALISLLEKTCWSSRCCSVTVWINPHAVEDTHLAGVVYLGELDVNRTMLTRGLGRFADPPAYSLSDYTRCLHRIAEREAREGRRGLWSKPSLSWATCRHSALLL